MATASEIKQKLQELSNKRTHLEGEVNEALARLNATGLGMEEPLVDSEASAVAKGWEARVAPSLVCKLTEYGHAFYGTFVDDYAGFPTCGCGHCRNQN